MGANSGLGQAVSYVCVLRKGKRREKERRLRLHSPLLSVFYEHLVVNKQAQANAGFRLWETGLRIRACLPLGCLQLAVGQALLPSCGEPGRGTAAGPRGAWGRPHGSGGTGPHGGRAGDVLMCFWARAIGCSPASSRTLNTSLHCTGPAGAGIVPVLHKIAGRESHWGKLLSSATHSVLRSNRDAWWTDVSFQGCSPY